MSRLRADRNVRGEHIAWRGSVQRDRRFMGDEMSRGALSIARFARKRAAFMAKIRTNKARANRRFISKRARTVFRVTRAEVAERQAFSSFVSTAKAHETKKSVGRKRVDDILTTVIHGRASRFESSRASGAQSFRVGRGSWSVGRKNFIPE